VKGYKNENHSTFGSTSFLHFHIRVRWAHSPKQDPDQSHNSNLKVCDLKSPINGKERFDLANQYLSRAGLENRHRALKLLRAIILDGQEEYMMQAMLLLIESREAIRKRYGYISDAEYEKSHNSIGSALFWRKNYSEAIDVLIEEAWYMSSSAQVILEIIYRYKVGEHPQYDRRILEFYGASAAKGNPRTQFLLGHIYANGWGVEKNKEKGLHYLTLSDWQRRGFTLITQD
jgi:TPR repeat protein